MLRVIAAIMMVGVLSITTLARQTSHDGLWFIASNDPQGFLPPPSEFRNVPGCISFVSIREAVALLQSAPLEVNGRVVQGVPFYLPDPTGVFHAFLVGYSPLVKDPEPGSGFATFRCIGIDDPTRRARISLTPRGLHAIVIGEPATYLVERAYSDDASVYTSHYLAGVMTS